MKTIAPLFMQIAAVIMGVLFLPIVLLRITRVFVFGDLSLPAVLPILLFATVLAGAWFLFVAGAKLRRRRLPAPPTGPR